MEERLDKILVQRNLVNTRVRAEQIIQEIGVKVNGKLIYKTGKKFPIDCKIELVAEELPWVSLDSVKLEEAYKKWAFEIKEKSFIDIGCSSGGFSEFLIENDAEKIYSIDNSKNILHSKISDSVKVIDLTGIPLRELNKKIIPEQLDGCVINSPFLSMEKVFPFIHSLLKPEGIVIALLKPSFEAEKDYLKHDGTVKSSKAYTAIIQDITKIGKLNNLQLIDSIESPILGQNSQIELIAFFRKNVVV
jgi:23S rRNA (cytidine1920-2'-O)/16S rRNA (cytidine1409-2'-O)-methyltransferase